LGQGQVKSIIEENRGRTTASGRPIIEKIARIEEYVKFNPPKIIDSEIEESIRILPNYNKQHSIVQITKDVYNSILSETEKEDKGETASYKEETFEDTQLGIPDNDRLLDAIKGIQDELLVDRDIIIQLVVNLASNRHILLAGPVGSGKTTLATRVSELIWKKDGGYYAEMFTATAEWSTQDVIGGIIPRIHEGKPTYEILFGCVAETIKKNWSKSYPFRRVPSIHNGKKYRGTWLIIDEFNRADIDKAFGPLFTALETRNLKVPTSTAEKSCDEITIPLDYRIIGTLNTADKHFLFKLSDALKRRFAYIEVFPPRSEQKESEIYYALKNALKELEYINRFEVVESIAFDEASKTINRAQSNGDILRAIDKAYDLLDFIRLTKQLGTAILKSIYQTLFIGFQITSDYEKSLDLALNANLIPQLENVLTSTLQTMFHLFFGDIAKFFREKHGSNEKDQYTNDFRKFLKYINAENQEDKERSFLNEQSIGQDLWNSINETLNNDKKYFKSQIFKASLEDLIKTTPQF
jgi:MoxR-like ATPase